MRVLIVGAAGMLGTDLCAAPPEGVSIIAADVEDVDITRPERVAAALDRARPNWVINAAAYTAVDRAEDDRAAADAVNHLGPRHLAEQAADRGIAIAHLSTDYVFPGTTRTPYHESDPVAPINAYGESKLRGELAVLSSGAHALVVRTQWLFGRAGRSFPRVMWERASARMPTRVVDDQFGRPTYTRDLAAAIWGLLARNASGMMHVTNGGSAATWYDLAKAVFLRAGAESLLSACSSEEYPTRARRPAYSVLATDRFEALSGPLPDWHEALTRFLDEITIPASPSRRVANDR
jgi:dTDP-4-dehydrorhamnose reductase